MFVVMPHWDTGPSRARYLCLVRSLVLAEAKRLDHVWKGTAGPEVKAGLRVLDQYLPSPVPMLGIGNPGARVV